MQCIEHVGTVHRVTERGDIRVQFDSINQRWTFHPRAIYRLSAFSVGDAVRITDNIAEVKQLQIGHGEWVDVMRSVRRKKWMRFKNSVKLSNQLFETGLG